MTQENLERIVTELRGVAGISDLADENLIWLAGKLTERTYQAGEVVASEGEPADTLYIVLEGEFQYRREGDLQDSRVLIAKPGNIGGKLPFSRLTNWTGTFRAVTSGRLLTASSDLFPEMIRDQPMIVQRLVGIMSDRIRYTTKEDQQRDKLAALGKLSAGLAHELNNPAAAAKSAALALSEAQEALREATSRLDNRILSDEQRKCIAHFERQALQHVQACPAMDSLTQNEQEEELASWFKKNDINEVCKLAPVLVEASLGVSWLEELQARVGIDALSDALTRIVSQILSRRLTKEIESSTGRISELVKAIKEYSYMDQAPVQELDIHHGIESTLVMLRYKLKHGITIERQYDDSLPRINAYGGELNQVWTNIIDNAADAMKSGGTLTIRTSPDRNVLVVEISDTGPGIPPEIQNRIFEPFFTTKKMGEGTGLGLDTVWRIIRKHHGDIKVESQPGRTSFKIRLPLRQE